MTKTTEASTTTTTPAPAAATTPAPKVTKTQFVLLRRIMAGDSIFNIDQEKAKKIADKIDLFTTDQRELIKKAHIGATASQYRSPDYSECSVKEKNPGKFLKDYACYLYIYAGEDAIIRYDIASYKHNDMQLCSSIDQKKIDLKSIEQKVSGDDEETMAGARLLSRDSNTHSATGGSIEAHDLMLIHRMRENKEMAAVLGTDSGKAILYYSTWINRPDRYDTVANHDIVSDGYFTYNEITPETDCQKIFDSINAEVAGLRNKKNIGSGIARIASIIRDNIPYAMMGDGLIEKLAVEKVVPLKVDAIKKALKEIVKPMITKASITGSFSYIKPYLDLEQTESGLLSPIESLYDKPFMMAHRSRLYQQGVYKDLHDFINEIVKEVGTDIHQKFTCEPIEYKLPEINKTIPIDVLNKVNRENSSTGHNVAIFIITKVVEVPVTESTRARIVDIVSLDKTISPVHSRPTAYRVIATDDKQFYDYLDVGNPVLAIITDNNASRQAEAGTRGLHFLRNQEDLKKLFCLTPDSIVRELKNTYNSDASPNGGTTAITIAHRNINYTNVLSHRDNVPIFSSDAAIGACFKSNSKYAISSERITTIQALSSTNPWDMTHLCKYMAIRYHTTEAIDQIIARNNRVNRIRKAEEEIIEEVTNAASIAFYLGLERMAKTGKPFSISPYGGKEVIEFGLKEIKFNNLRLTASNFILTYPSRGKDFISNKTSFYHPAEEDELEKLHTITDLKDACRAILANKQLPANSKSFLNEVIETNYFNKYLTELDSNFEIPVLKFTDAEGSRVIKNDVYMPLCAMFSYLPPVERKSVIDVAKYVHTVENTNTAIYMRQHPLMMSINSRNAYRISGSAVPTIATGQPKAGEYSAPVLLLENNHFEFDLLLDRFINTILAPIQDVHNQREMYDKSYFNPDEVGIDSLVDLTSGTIGLVNFNVQVKACSRSIRYYVNGKNIKQPEVAEVLKRALCFQKQEDYDRFVSDVSKLSLKARDLITSGLKLRIRSHDGTGTIALLEFDKSEKSWDLITRDKEGKIVKKHHINGGISKFISKFDDDRQITINDEQLYELLFEQIPTFDMESVDAIITNSTVALDRQLARSRKLLEDTVKATKAVYTTAVYGSKKINGYKVKGLSGTEYLIACELGKNDAIKDVKHDHGTDKMGAIYALPVLRRICIVDTGMRDQSGYDMIVNRLLAMSNDSLVVGSVGTLREYVNK